MQRKRGSGEREGGIRRSRLMKASVPGRNRPTVVGAVGGSFTFKYFHPSTLKGTAKRYTQILRA